MTDRYWDMTDKERAHLTREQVTEYLTRELMEQGIPVLKPLVLEEVPVVDLPRKSFYHVVYRNEYRQDTPLGPLFTSAEAAHALVASKPLVMAKEYSFPEEWVVSPENLAVVQVSVATEDAVRGQKEALRRADKARISNEAAKREYEKESEKRDKALNSLWGDWEKMKAIKRAIDKALETFKDYASIVNGDKYLASKFLKKAVDADTVALCLEWYPDCGIVEDAGE